LNLHAKEFGFELSFPENNVQGVSYEGSIPLWQIYKFLGECRERTKPSAPTMTPEKQERLKACLQELAAELYEETNQSELSDLESLEKTVRTQMLEYVSPQIALFLSNKQQESR
jgi:hypothetical protein